MFLSTSRRLTSGLARRVNLVHTRQFHCNTTALCNRTKPCIAHVDNKSRSMIPVHPSCNTVWNTRKRCIHTTASVNGKAIVPFNLADIGEAIAEVELVQWYVEVGDHVEQFDQVCLVESDKASTPITSRFSGKIVKLYYEEGDMAKTGLPLLDIEVDEDDLADDEEEQDQDLTDGSSASDLSAAAQSSVEEDEIKNSNEKYLMTPAVRRLVAEKKVNLAHVTATGKNGRILKDDVLRYLEDGAQGSARSQTDPIPPPTPHPTPTPTSNTAPIPPSVSQPDIPPMRKLEPLAEDVVVQIKGVQKAMVKSMNAANRIPHFGYNDECVVDGLVQIRNQLKETAAIRGIRLSYMPFIIKAVSLALTEYPILNSHVTDEDCTEMVMKSAHNIALAMDTPSGLIVPNVKNCEQKSVFEIASDLNQLQTLGAQGLLSVDNLSGGTFSLSNIGVVGGTYASPVLLVPQVAIGALGAVRKLPRYDENDNLVPRHIMEVSWSADHRVIDGVTMAKFSNLWKSFLENPALMLADLK